MACAPCAVQSLPRLVRMTVSSPYAAALERVPVREGTVAILGSSTRFWDYGDRDADTTLVLVHGFRGDHHGLEPVVAQLDGVRMVSPDLPGFGESTPMTEAHHDIDGYGRWLGAFVERETGLTEDPERRSRFHIWDGECHVHAGIRPDDIARTRAEHPEAEFLIHPECGCSTQAMEYVAAGDIDTTGVHMLSTSGMQTYVEEHPDGEFIVATENGMLYPLQQAAPKANLIEANRMAFCKYMKMITLPKLRDSPADMKFEVSVTPEIAERAKVPIERMVAIG